ncbi:MurR/RpiR family transcriptional regulator [Oscillospiraceae bacterium LTW-04]|nr:MurR/RpiR family transcriptional regulator [Oscillospiraceae bacterium MB24-C1]
MNFEKIESLIKNRNILSKKQRQLCDYILDHTDEIGMMSVAALSKNAKVGEATIFRFLHEIGYDNYHDFKRDVHAYSVQRISSSYWQLNAMLRSGVPKEKDSLVGTFNVMIEMLEKTLTPDLHLAFEKSIQMLLGARRILLFGLRSSKPIALYFESILTPFLNKVYQLSNDEHFIFDRVSQMGDGDVLFLITEWPYTKTSIEVARFCHEQGHPLILLTNNLSCSITDLADAVLLTRPSSDLFSRISAFAVLEAISNELATRLSPQSTQSLKQLDAVLKRYDVSEW